MTKPFRLEELLARIRTRLRDQDRIARRVLSREQLLSEIWGYGFDPGTNVVAVRVSNLRRKIGAHVIQTVRAFGYRLPVP